MIETAEATKARKELTQKLLALLGPGPYTPREERLAYSAAHAIQIRDQRISDLEWVGLSLRVVT